MVMVTCCAAAEEDPEAVKVIVVVEVNATRTATAINAWKQRQLS